MSVTLTPPVRVFAFVGVLVAVGLAAFLFLMLRPAADTTTAATAAVEKPAPGITKAAPKAPVRKAAASRKATLPGEGFPLPIRHALRRNRVVVVAVYLPGASVDAFVRQEARAGARGRAGFVAVSALSERLVRPLVAKTGVLPDPAVLVLRRPGIVTASLGVTDRQTVAQAVAQARR